MQVLHLIRKLNDAFPFEIVAEQLRNPEHHVRIVYLQDAVYRPRPLAAETYVLSEDCAARGVTSPFKPISYSDLVEMIFESERVISW